MNESAGRLIKEVVLRALLKSPLDVEFYREQMEDPSRPAKYRKALQEALGCWIQMQEARKRSSG